MSLLLLRFCTKFYIIMNVCNANVNISMPLVYAFFVVYNRPSELEASEIRVEVLSQLLPFLSSSFPRIQHASLLSLERLAEEHGSGKD